MNKDKIKPQLAAGFSDGDEVIVPAQTHTATSHAVEFTGAKAIFADIEYESANISVSDIKNKWAEELTGKNSDIPWTAARMNISRKFEIINNLFGKLIIFKIKQ